MHTYVSHINNLETSNKFYGIGISIEMVGTVDPIRGAAVPCFFEGSDSFRRGAKFTDMPAV